IDPPFGLDGVVGAGGGADLLPAEVPRRAGEGGGERIRGPLVGVHWLPVVVDVDAQGERGSWRPQVTDDRRTGSRKFHHLHLGPTFPEPSHQFLCIDPEVGVVPGVVGEPEKIAEVGEDLPTMVADEATARLEYWCGHAGHCGWTREWVLPREGLFRSSGVIRQDSS